MRWSISLCLTGLLFSMPVIAQASAESCGQMLLQPPAYDLYRMLGVNSAQASELESIKQDTARRQEALQYRLQQLRAELNQGQAYGHTEWLQNMEEQQIALEQQIEHEQQMAESRAFSVLNRWQRDRCAGGPAAYLPAPQRRIVVVHRPRPVVRPIPRVVVRPAPPRVHRAPPAPKVKVKYVPAPKKYAPAPKVKHAPSPKVKVKYQSKQGLKVAIKWGK